MKRYDSYIDSGVEWIGAIPEGWEVSKFSRISYMKGRIGWQGLKQTEFTFNPDDPYLITGMNFKDGVIDWAEVYHITEERYEEAPEIQLKDGDVLITKDGTIGKLLFVDKIPYPHKASLNSHLLVLRPFDHEYYPKYLFYQLQSIIFKHHVELTKTGTTFFGITQEAMGQFKALLPSHSEQTAIASFLDRKTAEIEQLIANKEKLISLYEEEKTAIINRAVTKGLDPQVTLKPSGVDWLGDIPEPWEVKRFKYLGRFVNGYSFNSSDFTTSGVRVMKISNIQTMKLDWSDESFVEESFYEKYEAFRVQRNDLVFALTRPIISTGIKAAIVDTDEDILLNQRNSMFKATDKVHTKWMYYLILNNQFVQEFDKQIDKTGQQPNISSNDIAEISVPVPLLSEQIEIIEHIEAECTRLDTIIDKFKKQIELFKEYRTTLISEVVTGKIDIRDEVAA